LFDETLTLNEGLNEYTITVTSKDESNIKEYSIRVIKLPDFSLQEFKLTNKSAGFEQDLERVDMQELLVSYEDIEVIAKANDINMIKSENITVSIDAPSTIENVNNADVTKTTTVTVTVTKELGIDPKYQSKSYVLILRYIKGIIFTPMAEGGFVSFIPAENPGDYYEVHRFEYNTEAQSLTFNGTLPDGGLEARVLVVGGGGGGGNAPGVIPGSGGGAGGMVEHDSYKLTKTSYPVKVGAGGKGGVGNVSGGVGAGGEDSTFGEEDGKFIACGGGGGAVGENKNSVGTAGGSSGGNNGNGGYEATKGTGPENSQAFGNAGGKGNRGDGTYTSGGGGGAGGPGTSVGFNRRAGGQGRSNNITGASVVYAAGGSGCGSTAGAPNTGNGGDGRPHGSGMAGGSGIVIVRFPFTPPEKK
jgi:hypothetical protein